MLDQPGSIKLIVVIEMRGGAEAAFADGDFGVVVFFKHFGDGCVIVFRRGEADDAAPGVATPGAGDGVVFFLQAGDQAIGERDGFASLESLSEPRAARRSIAAQKPKRLGMA